MKILFCDLDGTLVNGNESIHPLNIKYLNKFKNKGHKIVLTTGRTLFEVKELLSFIPYNYLILTNGASIIKDNKTIYEKTFSKDTGISIIETLLQYKDLCIYYCDGYKNIGYIENKVYNHGYNHKLLNGQFSDYYKNAHDFQIISCHNIYNNEEGIDDIINVLKDKYTDVEVYKNTFYIDIVCKDLSKGEGIRKLLKYISKPYRTYGIGDGENDISMFNICDFSATFSYASEYVKKHADNVYDYAYEYIMKILEDDYEF